MSSAAILEVGVPERAQTAQTTIKTKLPESEPIIAPPKEENHTRALLIGAFILGATMLSAMGGTLLIWALFR